MRQLVEYAEWQIRRSGELVMWGTGTVYVDYPDFEARDYELRIVDDDVTWTDMTFDYHALVADHTHEPDGGNYCGFAVGEVNHKMMPEASPDISARTVDAFEDVKEEVL